MYFKMNTLKKTWNGHAGTILAIDVSGNGLLSSVAEDGHCILWSLDGKILSDICVNTFVESTGSEDFALNSVKFTPNDPYKFFISSGNKVLGYDVRNSLSPFAKFEYNKEEINQISVSEKGEYLAACDDDGEIKIIDLRQDRLFKTLSARHSNICSSVQFRLQRPWQILSAGLDCNIIHWDYSTGKSRQIFNVNELLRDKEANHELFINPPFAHSLSISKDGGRFAVGLGNTFQFIKVVKAHDSEVSQVCYSDMSCFSWLISGGNDRRINMWKRTEAGVEDSLHNQILHGSKINWITCSSSSKDFIFVADQSSNINVYEIH